MDSRPFVPDFTGTARARILEAAGGPARLQIIAVLAAVLALDAVDKGTVSAVSDQLKQAFHIGNTQIGLLIALVSFIGAAARRAAPSGRIQGGPSDRPGSSARPR
jgi:hypothetical protein